MTRNKKGACYFVTIQVPLFLSIILILLD